MADSLFWQQLADRFRALSSCYHLRVHSFEDSNGGREAQWTFINSDKSVAVQFEAIARRAGTALVERSSSDLLYGWLNELRRHKFGRACNGCKHSSGHDGWLIESPAVDSASLCCILESQAIQIESDRSGSGQPKPFSDVFADEVKKVAPNVPFMIQRGFDVLLSEYPEHSSFSLDGLRHPFKLDALIGKMFRIAQDLGWITDSTPHVQRSAIEGILRDRAAHYQYVLLLIQKDNRRPENAGAWSSMLLSEMAKLPFDHRFVLGNGEFAERTVMEFGQRTAQPAEIILHPEPSDSDHLLVNLSKAVTNKIGIDGFLERNPGISRTQFTDFRAGRIEGKVGKDKCEEIRRAIVSTAAELGLYLPDRHRTCVAY
jgi:hypothetical protein